MYVTGKTARILKGRGKGKIGEITSCDAVGNVTIRTDDGKEYGPMPDWGNYVILGGSVLDVIRRDSALDIIRKTIGLGSRKNFEFAIIQSITGSDIRILMDDPNRIDATMKKLQRTELEIRLQEGEILCVLPEGYKYNF